MLYKRDYLDRIRDVLTSPVRADAAFWEGLQVLFGQESPKTVWNVLFNPAAADPEDLQQFSERFLGLSQGWTSFILDSTIGSPAVLLMSGARWAKGAEAFRFGSAPSAVGKQYITDAAPLYSEWSLKTYARLLDDIGFKEHRNMEILLNKRMSEFLTPRSTEWHRIKSLFSPEEWETSKSRLFWLADGHKIPGASAKEIEAARQIKEQVFDQAWDWVGTLQEVSGPNAGKGGAKPVGFISSYIPHLFRKDGLISVTGQQAVKELENDQLYKQLVRGGQLVPLPITSDTSISLAEKRDRFLQWLQQPGAQRIASRFIRKRTMKNLTPDAPPFGLELDIDRIVPEYLHRMSRTYALHTPITSSESAFLWGPEWRGSLALDVSQLKVMNEAIRKVSQATDGQPAQMLIDYMRHQAGQFIEQFRQVPQQGSLALQANQLIMQRLGVDLSKSGAMQKIRDPVRKIQARILHEWYTGLEGHHDVQRYTLGQMYATALTKMLPTIGPAIQQLDKLGLKWGEKGLGTKIVDALTASAQSYNAEAMERILVQYTTANVLGARLPSIMMNMVGQPATVNYTSMGFNAITGAREAAVRLSQAVKEANLYRKAQATVGRNVAWNEAIEHGFKTHLSEFMAAGIPRDYHALAQEVSEMFAGPQGQVAEAVDKFAKFVMQPYKASEVMNRVSDFYGTRKMYETMLKTRPRLFGWDARLAPADQVQEALNLASAGGVYERQFVPTSGGNTPLQARLGPGFRQFFTYPIRFVNYMLDAGVRHGIDDAAEEVAVALGHAMPGRKSWLPYARYLAVTGGLVNFSTDVLGMSLGEKIAEGAINLPLGIDQPFSPLPVAPIPNLLVNVAVGNTGKNMLADVPGIGTLPIPKILTPGGLVLGQTARMIRQMQGDSTQNVGPKAFIAGLLGLTTTESDRDYMKAERLMLVDSKIKRYRKAYATAIANGHYDEAKNLQAEYQREFKGGTGLSASRADILRVMENNRLGRLGRIAGSVSREARNIVDPALDPAGWYEVAQ